MKQKTFVILSVVMMAMMACSWFTPRPQSPVVPTATTESRATLTKLVPQSTAAADGFVYIGTIQYGQVFTYEGIDQSFVFLLSQDGKLIGVEKDSAGFYEADELIGGWGFNDVEFWPVSGGVDIWAAPGVSGYIVYEEVPQCVGVYEDSAYAMSVDSTWNMTRQTFVSRATCLPNGKLLIYREDIPAACNDASNTISAQENRKGMCFDKKNELIATWDYSTKAILYP